MSTPAAPPAEPTVCAVCVHKAVSKASSNDNPDDPCRWLCAATIDTHYPAVFHPLTGETTPAFDTLERCRAVNTSGDCPKYERRQEPKRPRALAIVRDSLAPSAKIEERPATKRLRFWPNVLLLTALSVPAILVTGASLFSGAVIGMSLAAAWALGRHRP